MLTLRSVSVIFFCFVFTAPIAAYGATVQVTGSVTRFLVQPGIYGGCMIQTTANLADAGLVGCSQFNWVSLDCEASVAGNKSTNSRMFEMAQMAYVLGKQVRINVTDYQRTPVGNQCRANRLDLQ